MADTNVPEGLDDFLTDVDPQSAISAQGLSQLGHQLGQTQAVQNVISGAPLKDYKELVNAAIAGDPAAKKAVMQHNVGLAMMGSVKAPITAKEAEIALGEVAAPGAIQKLAKKYGTEENLINQLGLTQQELNFAMQKANRLKPYAEGGEVPAGLDAFIASSPEASRAPASINPGISNEPHGLNEFIAPELNEEKYGTLGQQLKTGAEGLAQGLAGPLAPAAETALGVDPEAIRARAETNPYWHYGSEIAGLIGPAALTGGASTATRFTQMGLLEAGAKATAEGLGIQAGETLASKVGAGAAKAAIENMLLAGSDETSKMILNDPSQTAETAMATIGLSGVLGGALGSVSPLWSAAVGTKAGKVAEDFRARIAEHVSNPDPATAMHDELTHYYNNIKGLSDEVYGPTGLKSKDIEAALPKQMTPEISSQAQEIYNKLDRKIADMIGNDYKYPPRLVSRLRQDADAYAEALSKPDITPSDVFNASQDLKQTLQGYAKYEKFVKPVDEAYDFVKDIKGLAKDARESLESKEVWGKAAERQQAINKGFSQYLPALKDFEKKFTVEVGGEKVIDPQKVNTYLNQIGKPNAEIKQTMLKNFLDASEKYKKIISDSHANLGLGESPAKDSPMNTVVASFKSPTIGSKLADAFIEKGLTDAGSQGLGFGVGAGIGSALGAHGALAGIVGAYALGPMFKSVLPAIAKYLVSKEGSGVGLKAVMDYGMAAAKGDSILKRASKNLFRVGSEVIAENLLPNDKTRAKLMKQLQHVNANPQQLLNTDNKIEHYMPEHSLAMGQSTGNIISYLNQIRTDTTKKAPLDSQPVLSSTQKADFQRALDIAQQPIIVMNKIKDGSITHQDLTHLQMMYPSLYQGMQQKILAEMTNHIASGESIPYKTRIGLSMFLSQPMDSTMAPASIQSIQMQYANKSAQQGAPAPGRAPAGTKSSPALQKMGQMYSTSIQRREAREQKR